MKKVLLLSLVASPFLICYMGQGKVATPERIIVMSDPDHYAWRVFCEITEPRFAGSTRAGWESWTSAFRLYADPTQFNFWSAHAVQAGDKFSKRLMSPDEKGQFLGRSSSLQHAADSVSLKGHPLKPENAISADDSETSREDVMLNPDAAQYVIENGLLSEEGQEEMVKSGTAINFPPTAIEVKTIWIKLTNQSDLSRYYYQVDQTGADWGLQSLHLTTKDIPNWFWATFEHEDNYLPANKPVFKSSDSWGFTKVGKKYFATQQLISLLKAHHLSEDIWTHYRLGGSQVDFTDGAGRPVVRGNNQIEGGLPGTPATQASCMTCHSRSTVGARLDFHLQNDRVGVPDWRWFYGIDGEGNLVLQNAQRDFDWSLSRAKHKFASDGKRPASPEGMFWSISSEKQVSFDYDIMPLFLEKDIAIMKVLGVTLWQFQSVKDNAKTVYAHYAHTLRPYLPIDRPQWSPYLLNQFQTWMKTPVETPKN